MSIETAATERRYELPNFADARVADVMHPGVLTCPPETSLPTVGRMMARHRVHAVVVTGLEAEAATYWRGAIGSGA
jgi:CBS domain-containing protein